MSQASAPNDQVTADSSHTKFASRIQGMVNRLTTIRAIDRLNALATAGSTDTAHVKAWQKFRNRGVHPTTRDTEDVASLDYQRLIDELHRVTVLMYHIVFHLIGYRGPYTDYPTLGFPIKNYPVAAAPPSPPANIGSVPAAS